jgi:RNA polymerase sigma-70 factor (ECF subfamily)
MRKTDFTLTYGDPASLAQLFEAYADPIYRLALTLLRDPVAAEDIVQETFLSAWTHANRFEGRSSLRTWLYRIAYNASMDRLRRDREDPLPDEADGSEDDSPALMPSALIEWATPEQLLFRADLTHRLDEAIEKLPAKLRAVFVLRDLEELSIQETAEALDISPANVKVRLHRARLLLREYLSAAFGIRDGSIQNGWQLEDTTDEM